MITELYIFTNGGVVAFDENYKQLTEFTGKLLTEELKWQLVNKMDWVKTRVTLFRWRQGFFLLKPDEFLDMVVEDGKLKLSFTIKDEVVGDAENSVGRREVAGIQNALLASAFKELGKRADGNAPRLPVGVAENQQKVADGTDSGVLGQQRKDVEAQSLPEVQSQPTTESGISKDGATDK